MIFPFHDDNPTLRTPVVTFAIIGINAVVFLGTLRLKAVDRTMLWYGRGFVPARIAQLVHGKPIRIEIREAVRQPPGPDLVRVRRIQFPPGAGPILLSLLSCMFLHGGWFHLIINMYALWVFGGEVERMWGPKAFYRYYFITGIGAGIIHSLIALATGSGMVPTIGASGAVLGVLTAFAVMFPDRQITMLLFFILPVTMKARTLALLFAGMSLFSGMAGGGGIAHFAHLGGMLVGYLYMKQDWRFTALTNKFHEWRRRRRMHVHTRDEEEMEKLRRLVDQVLDKANDVGMENLTRDEKLLLKRASKILNREE